MARKGPRRAGRRPPRNAGAEPPAGDSGRRFAVGAASRRPALPARRPSGGGLRLAGTVADVGAGTATGRSPLPPRRDRRSSRPAARRRSLGDGRRPPSGCPRHVLRLRPGLDHVRRRGVCTRRHLTGARLRCAGGRGVPGLAVALFGEQGAAASCRQHDRQGARRDPDAAQREVQAFAIHLAIQPIR